MIPIIDSPLQRIKHMITRLSGYLNRGKDTYSQAGEDVIIEFLLHGMEITNFSYLELGTDKPDWGNNTYLFYKKGARGVLVEADERAIQLIKKVRPDDIILNIGVGLNNQREADFYIFETHGYSTFNKEEADNRDSTGKSRIVQIAKVQLKTINEIIAENFQELPVLLSIDIEGLDLSVLQSLNFEKYPIPIICAETCTYSENHIKPKDLSILKFMESKGYFVYADTYINTIFVNLKWFNITNDK